MSSEELRSILENTHLHLKLKPRSPRSTLFGIWDSPFVGDDGLELEEDREYYPGDNFKRVNAPLSSRMGKLMVKRYRETREVRMLIVLDASSSMMLREKLKAAFSALSVLYISAQEVFMPVSIWIVGTDYELQIRPPTDLQQLDHVVDALCGEDLNENPFAVSREKELSLDIWKSFLVRDSYVFVISDFLDGRDVDFKNLLDGHASQSRVIPVVVQDELEYSFPVSPYRFGPEIRLWDPENNATNVVRFSKKESAKVKLEHEQRFRELEELFKTDYLSYIHCTDPDIETIYEELQYVLNEERAKKR